MKLTPAFAREISDLKIAEMRLQETYAARQNASNAYATVEEAKRALATAVLAAGPLFTRDDLVRAVVAGIGDHAKYDETFEDQARRVVDEMLREGEG